jgi:DNA-binding transcriptional MocR family regulator
MNRYQVLATDIESAIRNGVLRTGDRLPSVRQTSHARKISASTVFQAYYLLEAKGLIHARERSGYFVATPQTALPPVSAPSSPENASSPVSISDVVFAMLEAGTRPNVVPLGSPFPDPSLFPLQQLGRSMAAAARNFTPRNTVEDLSPGKESLRRLIAQRYVARGVNVHPSEIVITNGALEALNLCLATVARPGDCIAIESPAFYGALQAIERLGMRAVPVATHPETGIEVDALERAIRDHAAKACWLMPTFQNPLGATMPDAKKQALVEMLARHAVPLIEDDVYAELHFGESAIRPAKAWDTQGLVLHCSSFSKSLAPGYRIGWVAPGQFFRQVARQKLTTTLMASMPGQLGLVDYLRRGGFDRHLRKLRQALESRHA